MNYYNLFVILILFKMLELYVSVCSLQCKLPRHISNHIVLPHMCYQSESLSIHVFPIVRIQ